MKSRHDFSHSGALRLLAGLAQRQSYSLYVRSGPGQLFERLESSAVTSASSWLYLPPEYGRMVLEQAMCTKHADPVEAAWLDPLSVDDCLVFPIVRCDEIIAAIATPGNQAPKPNARDRAEISSALAVVQESAYPDVRHLAAAFVRELFHRDNTVPHFIKRLLGLMTAEWPRSCAGLYTEVEGTYHLRLATGDVSRWHCLPGSLGPDATVRYLESIYRQEYFVAAETTPDYPALLDNAPDFVFVHEGVLSERSKQLLVMAGPGTLATLCVNRLVEYGRLLRDVHELQFAHGLELLHSYNRLACAGPMATETQLLKDLFEWLSLQLSVSRLELAVFEEDDHISLTAVAGATPAKFLSPAEYTLLFPSAALAAIRAGKTWHSSGAPESGYSEIQAGGRFASNVQSELYIPLSSPGGVLGALVVGSAAAGDYLMHSEDLFISVAAYLSVWLQFTKADYRFRAAGTASII